MGQKFKYWDKYCPNTGAIAYMQAFEDVNKRTARLVANIPLIKKNLKPLSFTDVEQEAYVKSLL